MLEVNWLIKKCYAVFDEMLDSLALDCKDYLKMVRLVDEAQLFASMDERHRCLLENTIKRIQDIRATSFFLSNYIKDLDCLSLSEIDTIIKIAGSEVDIIVRLSLDIILGLIRNDTKVILTENMNLLSNCDLSLCLTSDSDLYERLFDEHQNLINASADDFKFILRLYPKSKRGNETKQDECLSISKKRKLSSDLFLAPNKAAISKHLEGSRNDLTPHNLFHDSKYGPLSYEALSKRGDLLVLLVKFITPYLQFYHEHFLVPLLNCTIYLCTCSGTSNLPPLPSPLLPFPRPRSRLLPVNFVYFTY